MVRMRSRLVPIAAALLVLAGCAPAPEAEAPLPDTEVGLVAGSVFDTPEPPPTVRESSDPGEAPLPERPWPGAPPVIPHGIEDFLPITLDANACLDCHAVEEKVEGEATPIPESHYRDLRNAPGEVRAEVAGSRWLCTSCHVARTDAEPLVASVS